MAQVTQVAASTMNILLAVVAVIHLEAIDQMIETPREGRQVDMDRRVEKIVLGEVGIREDSKRRS